jgi:hypothetical protein
MSTTFLDPGLAAQAANGGNGAGTQLPNGATVGGAPRAIYVHAVPAPIAAVTGVTHIGIVKLTPNEELGAFARAHGDGGALSHELVKESFRQIRDAQGARRLGTFDGSVDRIWGELDPVVRVLVSTAYNFHHQPDKDLTADFLKSFETTV